KPDLVHLVTVKPVLYGGIAARMVGVPAVVAAISGLGHVFIAGDLRTRILRTFVQTAYRVALRRPRLTVIFQNAADWDVFANMGAVALQRTVLIRGSGVDLREYCYIPEPDGVPVVTFAARLLESKGVYEFVAAATELRARGVRARFYLVGDLDPGNIS